MTRSPDATAAFDLQPTLTGKLVELRPLRNDDYDAVYTAASDPLIWEQHPEPDRHHREVFQRYWDTALESGGAFAVVERGTGRIIGCTRYHSYKPDESEIEIGWTFLERKYWGGEYNGEMKRLLLDHAFRFVKRVVLIAGEHNWRSRKAIEKIGGKLLRTVERPDRHGKIGTHVVYRIDRDAYMTAETM